jgi:hypothetical protein
VVTQRDVEDSDAVDAGVRLGLVAYGVVHLLVAYTAVRLLLEGHQGTKANQRGVLVLWQGHEAVNGHTDDDGASRTLKRVASAGRGIVYLALAVVSVQTAVGDRSGGGTDGLTARVMSASGGRYLVGAVGLAIIGIGLGVAYVGVSGKFLQGLDGQAHHRDRRSLVVVLGRVGHVGKGLTLCAVGGLFVTAAVQFEPRKSGGLDQALRTLLQQPFGPYLVGAVALGLLCFGLYCLLWARHRDG